MFCTKNGKGVGDVSFGSDENDGDGDDVGKIMVLAVLMRGDEPCELTLPSVTSIIYHLLHTGRGDDQAFVRLFRFRLLFILRS